ncbi:MAG: hypothetical protein LUH47_11050, partial [Clostridiales bacterium]|nr:hypothetical protein [Clostridiales bacterium]
EVSDEKATAELVLKKTYIYYIISSAFLQQKNCYSFSLNNLKRNGKLKPQTLEKSLRHNCKSLNLI